MSFVWISNRGVGGVSLRLSKAFATPSNPNSDLWRRFENGVSSSPKILRGGSLKVWTKSKRKAFFGIDSFPNIHQDSVWFKILFTFFPVYSLIFLFNNFEKYYYWFFWSFCTANFTWYVSFCRWLILYFFLLCE